MPGYMIDADREERMNRSARNEKFRRQYPGLAAEYELACKPASYASMPVDLEQYHKKVMQERQSMTMTTTTTDSFSATLGVVAGYKHDNVPCGDPLDIVAATWDAAAELELAAGGLYVPCVATASRTIYRREWGCPVGGEITVTLTGTRNPQFDTDSAAWKKAVAKIAERVRVALKQSTAHLAFSTCDSLYLK